MNSMKIKLAVVNSLLKIQVKLFLLTCKLLKHFFEGQHMKFESTVARLSLAISASAPVTFTPETGKEEVAEGQNFTFNFDVENSAVTAELTPEEFNHEVSCLLEENKHAVEKVMDFFTGVVNTFGEAIVNQAQVKTNISSYRAETERQEAEARIAESLARAEESKARTEDTRARTAKL